MTQILSDEEIEALADVSRDPSGGVWPHNFAKALQAAILAKLASAELPEPFGLFCGVRHDPPKTKEFWGMLNEGADNGSKCNLYTADQLRQAYAQGAAAQLSAEPVAWSWVQDKFHNRLEQYRPTIYDKDTLAGLYTRKEAK